MRLIGYRYTTLIWIVIDVHINIYEYVEILENLILLQSSAYPRSVSPLLSVRYIYDV